MRGAYGKSLGTGDSGRSAAPASSLPESLTRDLSRHPQGNVSRAIAPAVAPSLDLLKHNRNKNMCRGCGKFSIFGETKPGTTQFVRLGCKAWRCARCGPKRAKRVRRGIIEQALQHKLTRLLTLTLDQRHCSAADSSKYLKRAYCKFRTQVKRKTGTAMKFITITEFQKNGYAHLHVLVDRYLHQTWASLAWQRVGGGRIVDIRKVDMHRVAGYLSKYLTKGLLLGNPNQKYRRYTTSRDICLLAKTEKGKWVLIKRPIDSLSRALAEVLFLPIIAEDRILEGFTVLTGELEP